MLIDEEQLKKRQEDLENKVGERPLLITALCILGFMIYAYIFVGLPLKVLSSIGQAGAGAMDAFDALLTPENYSLFFYTYLPSTIGVLWLINLWQMRKISFFLYILASLFTYAAYNITYGRVLYSMENLIGLMPILVIMLLYYKRFRA